MRIRIAPPAWCLGLACLGSIAPAAAGDVAVVPGGIARWQAEDTTSCSALGRTWAPLGDTCWFPVDLLTPAGPVSVRRVRAGREESALLQVGAYPYPEEHLRVPERQVHLSKKDLARVKREEARTAPLWQREGPAAFTLPLSAPLAELPRGGRFGSRRFFNGVSKAPHGGSDYKAQTGTPVLAVAPGTVVLAEDQFFSGNSVFVDHGGGLVSMYFHLSAMAVKPGERVDAGGRIGSVGATGRVTGPHLHFGLRWHGARIDPELLLRGLDRVPSIGTAADGTAAAGGGDGGERREPAREGL